VVDFKHFQFRMNKADDTFQSKRFFNDFNDWYDSPVLEYTREHGFIDSFEKLQWDKQPLSVEITKVHRHIFSPPPKIMEQSRSFGYVKIKTVYSGTGFSFKYLQPFFVLHK
jgi:hypothetical protein